MLKHSNSAVTSVIIWNSNFLICPDIPRSALGNEWDSLHAGDPQVARDWEAAMDLYSSPNLLVKSSLKSFLLSPETVSSRISEYVIYFIPTLPMTLPEVIMS